MSIPQENNPRPVGGTPTGPSLPASALSPASHPISASAPALRLEQLNAASCAEFTRLLEGTYEHSPWIAERAWPRSNGPWFGRCAKATGKSNSV